MKTQKADVKLNFIAKGQGGEWKMAVGMGNANGPGRYEKLVVQKGNDGEMVFVINSPKISFAKVDPIVFSKNGAPLAPEELAQFSWVIDQAGRLVVKNSNSVAVPTEYYYQLNFDGAPPLDPIIANGCCSNKLIGSNNVLLGAEAVGAAIALLLLFAVTVSLVAIRARRRQA